MQLKLKTILNLKEKYFGFIYKDIRLNNNKIEIKIEARKGSKGVCSGCGKKCPGYDRLAQREFIHVPFWGLTVIFLYCMRRLQCPECGVGVESVPGRSGNKDIA